MKNFSHLTKDIQLSDALHHLHPFTDAKQINNIGTRVIENAKGVWIWDSDDNKILDAMAGLWCVNIGYGREEIAQVAYDQIKKLSYYNLFFQCTHPKATELAEVLSQVTPNHMNHVFFTSSGSESNDTIIRFVRHYWSSLGQPNKSVIISRHNAYHGSSMGGASLGGMKSMHAQGGLPIPDIVHIEQPYWFQNGGDLTPQEHGIQAAQSLEKKILEMGEEHIAAFIAEPVQGAGGVIVPADSYWQEINRILKKYNILFVADEVICGFGRTGNWFGSDTYQLKPDMMAIAKGLSSGYSPIGGVVLSDKVADVLINQAGELCHGYTYSGHPLSAAIAIENLSIMRREKMVENVQQETAPYFQKRWQEFNKYDIVGETRGVGMLGALQLCADKSKRTLFAKDLKVGKEGVQLCIKHQLVMRAVEDSMIVCPPLCITTEEIDILIERAHKVMQELQDAFLTN